MTNLMQCFPIIRNYACSVSLPAAAAFATVIFKELTDWYLRGLEMDLPPAPPAAAVPTAASDDEKDNAAPAKKVKKKEKRGNKKKKKSTDDLGVALVDSDKEGADGSDGENSEV